MYSWESEITSLISIKECKDSPLPRLPLQSRERHVAWLFSLLPLSLFALLLPSKDFELGKHISLHPLTYSSQHDEPATQHIPRRSPVLSIRCVRLGLPRASTMARYRRRIVARTFGREIARTVEATNRRMRQRLYDDCSVRCMENVPQTFR